MSIGKGSGQNRAVDAAKAALASPLLDVSVSGAKGVLFNVVGGENLSLFEVNEAAEIIKQAVDPDANIIFGVVRDSRMDKDIKITLIATGFETTSMSGNNVNEAEISGYLKTLKGDNEEQLDVPAFLRRAQYSQRHIPRPGIRSRTAASGTKKPRPTIHGPGNHNLETERGLGLKN